MSGGGWGAAAGQARVALTAVFFAVGLATGAWAACIPGLKRTLALSDARLGVALLAVAGGALVAMPAAGWLAARVGSRRATAFAALAFGPAVAAPALAGSYHALLAAAAVLGLATGGLDAAMNAHATAAERSWGAPIMSSFHAFFSLGGLAGAAAAGAALARGASWPHTLVVAAGGALLLAALAAPRLRLGDAGGGTDGGEGAGAGGHPFVLPSRAVLGVGVLALLCMLAEGAMADWSAVYLGTIGAGAGAAAAGYAAFSLAMAAGRLAGDRMVARLGGPRVLRVGGLAAAFGLALALVPADPRAATAGLALVGLGLANVVPVLFTAAGRVGGPVPAIGVAMAATVGYTGFLAGPPLIGFAASLIGLRLALAIPALGCAVIAACARWVDDDRAGGGRRSSPT